MTSKPQTVHASAVCVGEAAVLIRGPSGSGKSRLAFELILAARARLIPATRLIGDDRIDLQECGGALVARAVPALAGLIEVRGLGIRRIDSTDQGIVGLVVDLAAEDAARLPEPEALQVRISGVVLPRLPVAAGFAALPLVFAALTTEPMTTKEPSVADCRQELINHIRSTLASP